MNSTYRRNATALGLLGYALLNTLSVLVMPDVSGGPAHRLSVLDHRSAAVGSVAFLVAQLPGLVGFLGIGHLLRRSAPRCGTTGASVAALGAFGHTVFGGMSLVLLAMAAQPGDRRAMAAVLDRLDNSPAMLFSLLGLGGTVVGIALLAIGLWRGHVGPRWVPAGLGAFLVVEFVGTALSTYASYVSAILLVLASVGLAGHVVRTPSSLWSTPTEVPAPASTSVAV
jgi:hypothetical protein